MILEISFRIYSKSSSLTKSRYFVHLFIEFENVSCMDSSFQKGFEVTFDAK